MLTPDGFKPAIDLDEEEESFRDILTQEILSSMEGTENKLESKSMIEARVRLQVDEVLRYTEKRADEGFETLITKIIELSQEKPDEFDINWVKELDKLSEHDDGIQELTLNSSDDDESDFSCMRTVCEISNTAFDGYKKVADYLMSHDLFKEAADVLFFLNALDPYDSVVMIALGSAEYHLGNYEGAKQVFELAILKDEANPYPYLYAAHCYENLNEPARACELVNHALSIIGDHPDFEDLRNDSKKYLMDLQLKVNGENV